ncbi:MAG: LamG-like jellyroll fold domain-containing protein [Candidatus Cloacimonadota bacterium]
MKTNLKLLLSVLFLMITALPVFALFPGNCLNFESGDYVSGSGIPASFPNGFTIEGWINHSSLSPNIQRYFTVLGENIVLRLDEGRVDFYIKASSGAQYRVRPVNVLATGQWYHVAATYDGATMKLYVNGSLMGHTTTSGGLFPIAGGAYNIGNGGEPMIGKIDELRLWNVVRNQSDIAAHLYQEIPVTQTGLRSNWRFNESSGTVAADLCGNSHGTLIGMSDANWVAHTIPHQWYVGESGTISTNTTFVNDVTVVHDATLTIDPGVTLSFAPGKKLIIYGNLIAEGTADNRVTFTASNPEAGWGGITFDGGDLPDSNSKLKYSIVEHGHNTGHGGNIKADSYSVLELENCIIRDAYCDMWGGALYAVDSSVRMINCLLYNNYSHMGTITINYADVKLLNCTIVDNSTSLSPGAILCHLLSDDPQPVIRNCIIWNNGSSPIGSLYEDLPTDVQYCNIEGGYTGTGNLNTDPGFTGETGNPYAISKTSYCIEAGINETAGLTLPATDLMGNPRIYNHSTANGVDMGAYEYQGYPAPINLRASDGDDRYPGYVQLLWEYIWTYTHSPNEFRILRNGAYIGTASGLTHSYQDYNVVPGTIYTYQVLVVSGTVSASSLEDIGYIKPNGIISGRVQTINNNPVTGVKVSLSPAVGKCLQLNAASASSISIPNPGVYLNQDFTVELWVKTEDSDLNLLDSGNHHLKIVGGQVVYTDGNHTLTQQDTAVAVNDNSWHHIAVVNNVSANTVEMYLDSFKVAVATGYYFANYTAGDFTVPSGFTGYLDDLRLWEAVRDSSQIVDAMSIVMPSNSAGLKGYWAMNEGIGTMLFDGTNYAHNAVASNCIWSSSDAGMALGAMTNNWGDYVISQIPYGNSTTFTVTPSKPVHIFQPETRTVTLSSSNIAANNVDFTDNSMIPISGKVRFYGTIIPVVNASIWLNGVQAIPPVLTDATGSYVLEVEHGTSCNVSVVFNDHVFTGNGDLGAVTFPMANVNFTDTFQTQLCVQVVGGSQSFPIGNYKITATTVDDSYDYIQVFNEGNTANWGSGQLVLTNLPPLNYNIVIAPFSGPNNDPFDLQVDPLFTKNKSIDLSDADAQGDTLRFEWRAPLQAEVTWDPALELKYMASDSSHSYGFYVMQQNVWQEAVVRAVEDYNYGSYTDHIISLTDCDIEITDDVGAIPTSSTSLNGANSFTYSFAPYLPNITSGGDRSYQKNLQITVSDPDTERSATNITWILTEGASPRGSTYSSTSPEIPILILHDPPGDGSYASFDQSSSHSYAMSFSYSDSEGSSAQAKVSLGLDVTFNTGIMFSVQTNLDVVADLGYGYTTSSTLVSDTTMTTTLTTSEAYQTSSQDMLIGQASDLYIDTPPITKGAAT